MSSQNRRLRVREVSIGADGVLEMELKADGREWVDSYGLPSGVRPHPDLIACAVAAVYMADFDEFEYLSPISRETRHRLESATRSKWDAPLYSGDPPPPGRKSVLSFSGGLDSLAAYALMGEETQLVSIDFGDGFERERDFFGQFRTNVIATQSSVRGRSWTFMGLAAILLRDSVDGGRLAFGTILEATPWHFLRKTAADSLHPIFAAAGYSGIAPVKGLTEFGTTAVAAQAFPDLMPHSLDSLAAPHTEKYLRKLALLELVRDRLGLDYELPEAKGLGTSRVKIGDGLATDFLLPGMVKFASSDRVMQWADVPRGMFRTIEKLSLDFYFRENGDLAGNRIDSAGDVLAANQRAFGIMPYSGEDWEQFKDLVRWLRMFHQFPGETW